MPLIMPLFRRYIAVNPSHLYVGMAKALEKSIFGPWKKHNFDDPTEGNRRTALVNLLYSIDGGGH